MSEPLRITASNGTARPTPAEKLIHAPSGYGFRVGQGRTLVRRASNCDVIAKILLGEFRRCGWPTAKVKVVEKRAPELPPNERGVFYLNLGFLRGLDPDAVYAVLKTLPDKCGHRALLARIAKLPERVEVTVPISEVVG